MHYIVFYEDLLYPHFSDSQNLLKQLKQNYKCSENWQLITTNTQKFQRSEWMDCSYLDKFLFFSWNNCNLAFKNSKPWMQCLKHSKQPTQQLDVSLTAKEYFVKHCCCRHPRVLLIPTISIMQLISIVLLLEQLHS